MTFRISLRWPKHRTISILYFIQHCFIPRYLVQLLEIRILIANSAHSSVSGLFYYLHLLAAAQRTNLEAVANDAMKFLNTDFVFFCSKDRNDAPRSWKVRDDAFMYE
jgi:hypothetical protein